MCGYQFLRQRSIDNYIVDFFCKELMLAIEIDGSSHDKKIDEDRYRQERLEIIGITFLRFTENEIRTSLGSVLCKIKEKVTTPIPPLKEVAFG